MEIDFNGYIDVPCAYRKLANQLCGTINEEPNSEGLHKYFNIKILTDWYLVFKDSKVFNLLMSDGTNYSDDNIGITETKWANLSDITDIFHDTDIEEFPELELTKIEDLACSYGHKGFYNCTNLRTIKFPRTLKRIATVTKDNISIDLNSEVKMACQGFANCINLELNPATDLLNITALGASCFLNCEKIEGTLNMPNITQLGLLCFSGTSITIIDDIGPARSGWYSCTGFRNMGDGAFSYMPKLTEVTFPENMYQQDGMFMNDTNLKTIHIPESVTTLQTRLFRGCSKLDPFDTSKILVFGSLCLFETQWDHISFESAVSINGNMLYNNKYITEIEIPETVTYLGGGELPWLFGLRNLRKLTINSRAYDTLTFRMCTWLHDINIKYPETITKWGNYGFLDTYLIGNFEIPKNLNVIGNGGFHNAHNLFFVKSDHFFLMSDHAKTPSLNHPCIYYVKDDILDQFLQDSWWQYRRDKYILRTFSEYELEVNLPGIVLMRGSDYQINESNNDHTKWINTHVNEALIAYKNRVSVMVPAKYCENPYFPDNFELSHIHIPSGISSVTISCTNLKPTDTMLFYSGIIEKTTGTLIVTSSWLNRTGATPTIELTIPSLYINNNNKYLPLIIGLSNYPEECVELLYKILDLLITMTYTDGSTKVTDFSHSY